MWPVVHNSYLFCHHILLTDRKKRKCNLISINLYMYWSLCSSIKKNIANTRTKWCKPGIAMRSPFSSLNPKSTFGWINANLLITNKEYIWFYSLLIKPTLETSLCCLLGYKICNLHYTFLGFCEYGGKGEHGIYPVYDWL